MVQIFTLLVVAVVWNAQAKVESTEISLQFFCKRHVCNELPGFSKMLLSTFDDRIATKEAILMKQDHVQHCLNSSALRTMVFLTKNQSAVKDWSLKMKKHVWLTGSCSGNVSIVLATNPLMNCSLKKLNISSLMKPAYVHIPSRIEVMKFIECMVHLFFEAVSNEPTSLMNSTMTACHEYINVCSLHLTPKFIPSSTDFNTDSDSLNTTIAYNDSVTEEQVTSSHSTSEAIKPSLQKHHGGGTGNIPYLVITLVCTLCGGSCLSFLLCFRRVRHLVCSCCSICRDVNHYGRLFNDD